MLTLSARRVQWQVEDRFRVSEETFDYHELVGRDVEIVADGIVYRGRLVEMGEEDIHLESSSGWTTIRVDRVSSVRLAKT